MVSKLYQKGKIMFNASSILSSLLRRTAGIPEVNLNKLPFANKIVGDWEEKSMKDLIKQLPKETIQRLIKVCNEELASK
jgi:hypothetical protein